MNFRIRRWDMESSWGTLGERVSRIYTSTPRFWPRDLLRPVAGWFQVVLPFCGIEIILNCFQTGRMNQWARAHFFVGRDKWRSAEASLLKVPAYDALVVLGRGLEWNGRDSGWTAPGSALAVS
jgi:hypothetical protein